MRGGLLICILSLASGGLAAERNPLSMTLRPGDPSLEQLNVPRLHEEVAEEELSGDGLLLEPETGRYHWTSDGSFRLRVEVDATRFEHGIFTVWNWENKAVQQRRMVAGEPGVIEIEVAGFGSYLLTLDGYSDGGYGRRLIRNIAVTRDLNPARETWKTDEFFLGICTFPGRYHWTPGGMPTLPAGLSEGGARELEAELMARLGFQVVRVDESLEMGRREGTGGDEYIFDTKRMDAAVEAYTSRGFQLGLQIMNAADWAVLEKYAGVKEHRWRYPHEEAAQRAYIQALLERYGEWARFVQVFNEPDQVEFWAGTPDEFVDQFRFSRDQVRQDLPDVPVANGGYAFVDAEKTKYFIEHLHDLVDLPAYHAHGELSGMIKNFERLKQHYCSVGIESAQWVNTETGFDAWRLDQERRQAQAVTQKVLYGWANDHAGVMLFCGRMTRGPGRDGRDLGLVDYQFCPRFAYGAVAGLVSVLSGASYASTLIEGEGIFAHEFILGEDRIVSAFSLTDKGQLAFESDAVAVAVFDAMGNEVNRRDGGGGELELDGYPRYLLFRNASRVGLR